MNEAQKVSRIPTQGIIGESNSKSSAPKLMQKPFQDAVGPRVFAGSVLERCTLAVSGLDLIRSQPHNGEAPNQIDQETEPVPPGGVDSLNHIFDQVPQIMDTLRTVGSIMARERG